MRRADVSDDNRANVQPLTDLAGLEDTSDVSSITRSCVSSHHAVMRVITSRGHACHHITRSCVSSHHAVITDAVMDLEDTSATMAASVLTASAMNASVIAKSVRNTSVIKRSATKKNVKQGREMTR